MKENPDDKLWLAFLLLRLVSHLMGEHNNVVERERERERPTPTKLQIRTRGTMC